MDNYTSFGLSSPIDEKRFEWIIPVENGYCSGCIVVNNDRAINIVGRKEYFKRYM